MPMIRYMLLVVFTGLVFGSVVAAATESYCLDLKARLQVELEESWYQHYRPLVCSDNTYHLAGRILPGLPLQTPVYGVYVRKWYPVAQPIEPGAARDGKERWGFHMFLVVDGLVVDLDYGNTPAVIGWRDYMQTMWPDFEGVYLQFKSAWEIRSTELGGRFNEYDYPLVKMKDHRNGPPFSSDCSQY